MIIRNTARGGPLAPILVLLAAAGLGLAAGAEAHRLGHGSGPLPHHDPIAEHGTVPERVRALIDRYHLSGDDHLLEDGWILLEPALSAEQKAPAALLAAAWLAQAGHEFERAERYLRHVIVLRPDLGEAWLLQASVALVQGKVEVAREACSRTTLTVPVVVTAACFARVEAHHAAPDGVSKAYRRLAATLEVGSPARADLLGWLHGVAGDLAARGGRARAAGEHYRTALQLTPTVSIRAGYADLLLAIGRTDEVLALIGPQETAPSLVLRRLLAQKLSGEGVSPGELAGLEAQLGAWVEAGDLRHAREMALFYLHVQPNVQLAYELARRNFGIQREPEDRALLCEAGARVGAPVGADCPTGAASSTGATTLSSTP